MTDRFNGQAVSDRASVRERASQNSCGIAFMATASVPGRAKTRLVPPLTFAQAADLNTAFLQDVADNLVLAGEQACAGAGQNVAIVGYAAYGPADAIDFFRLILPSSIGLIEAWLPNFGDCRFHTIGENSAARARGTGNRSCRTQAAGLIDVDDVDALTRLDAELHGADVETRQPAQRFAAHTAKRSQFWSRRRARLCDRSDPRLSGGCLVSNF
jgi:hypothetical protein